MNKRKAKTKLADSNRVIVKHDPPKGELPPGREWPKFLALALIVAFVALAYVMTSSSQTPKSKAAQAAFAPRNLCKSPPAFMRGLRTNQGFGAGSALSTSERDLIGLAVVDFDPQSGQRLRAWQHPSWRSAGNLSAFALDQRGDVYVIPAPRVNLLENPPAQQNRLYRVDSSTAEMTLALEFPVAAAVSQRNPFAGLGLSYDCALDSLFLSSVAGSTPSEQRGKVYRIALRPSAKIVSTLANMDIFAVTSVASASGTALVLGSARDAEVLQIDLDANGDFPDSALATPLLSISGFGPDGNDRARKIEVGPDGTLTVRGARFAFNLAQPSAQDKATSYVFAFDASTQSYQFQRWMK